MKLPSIKMQAIEMQANKKTIKITLKFIRNNAYLLFSKKREKSQAKMEVTETENKMNAIKIAKRIIMGEEVSPKEENTLEKINAKLYMKIKKMLGEQNYVSRET